MSRRVLFSLALATAALLQSCGSVPPKKEPPPPLAHFEKIDPSVISFDDDESAESLIMAVEASLKAITRKNNGASFMFGGTTVTPSQMETTLIRLMEIFSEEPDPLKRSRKIADEFDAYARVETGGPVTVTGYYQPVMKGSRSKNGVYKWPIYRAPDDLVVADLGLFHHDLVGKKITGRVENGKLIPYHDRAAIDTGEAIAGRGLEVAWVDDPFALFILHVQGSGIVEFDDGSAIHVNYAASNGRPYRSIGRILVETGEIPPEEQSLNSIKKWLDTHPDKFGWLLNQNASYVFFREMDDGPFGSTGAKLVAGRSAAFDPAFFPEGGVALMITELPVTENGAVVGMKKSARLIFNHDRGGAIKGAGRVDLFMGRGPTAGNMAGNMKQNGSVFFLLKKGIPQTANP